MADKATFQAIAPRVFDAFGDVIRPVVLENQGRQTVAPDGLTITADATTASARAFIYDASYQDAALYGVELGTSLALISPPELAMTPRTNTKLTATDTGEVWYTQVASDPTGANALWVLTLHKTRLKQ